MKVKCHYCDYWFEHVEELAMHLYPQHKFDLSLPVAKAIFKMAELDKEAKSSMVADYRHDYSGKANLLKSLLK